jgi:hypothetical protein
VIERWREKREQNREKSETHKVVSIVSYHEPRFREREESTPEEGEECIDACDSTAYRPIPSGANEAPFNLYPKHNIK